MTNLATVHRQATAMLRADEPAGGDRPGVVRFWLVAWIGAALLGTANGAAREAFLRDRFSELNARRLSTQSLLFLLGGYTYLLDRRRELPDRSTALGIGGAWAGMTVLFEVLLGRRRGLSYGEIFADYDLLSGRLWVLVPLAMLLYPAFMQAHRTRDRS